VVTDPEPVTMVEFKSEYEFVTNKSTINGNLVMLAEKASILDKMIV
jgi:hypothetical protein